MKRINCRAAAVEAVITRHGTVVGPVMRDLTGHPELTPYSGGWCGNDIFPDALSPEHRERARVLTEQLGDRLATEGYRGFFEVDYLVDVDTGELYLGELNPRLSGDDLDDVRERGRVRRHAAGPAAPDRVPGRRLRDRRRRDQRPLGPDGGRRRVEPARDQGDPRGRRAADRGAARPASGGSTPTATPRSRARGTTGTASATRARRSTCRSSARASTATRAPTSACSSPARGCRPTATS